MRSSARPIARVANSPIINIHISTKSKDNRREKYLGKKSRESQSTRSHKVLGSDACTTVCLSTDRRFFNKSKWPRQTSSYIRHELA